jgi:hypothetical protein
MRKTSLRRTDSSSRTATLPSGYRSTKQLPIGTPSTPAIIVANAGLAVPVKIVNALFTPASAPTRGWLDRHRSAIASLERARRFPHIGTDGRVDFEKIKFHQINKKYWKLDQVPQDRCRDLGIPPFTSCC